MSQGKKRPTKKKKPSHPGPLPTSTLIVDTNVLVSWAWNLCGAIPPYANKNADSQRNAIDTQNYAAMICEDTTHRMVIPPIIWLELSGVFLQKDIDLDNYPLWRRFRRAALQAIAQQIIKPQSHISIGRDLSIAELAAFFHELHPSHQLIERLAKERNQRRINRPDFSSKLLDGIDAVLLAYAWEYARLHPHLEVRLLSDDNGIRHTIHDLHHCARSGLPPIPSNLGCCSSWGYRTEMHKRTPKTLKVY